MEGMLTGLGQRADDKQDVLSTGGKAHGRMNLYSSEHRGRYQREHRIVRREIASSLREQVNPIGLLL
jgi:hypothetical protein